MEGFHFTANTSAIHVTMPRWPERISKVNLRRVTVENKRPTSALPVLVPAPRDTELSPDQLALWISDHFLRT